MIYKTIKKLTDSYRRYIEDFHTKYGHLDTPSGFAVATLVVMTAIFHFLMLLFLLTPLKNHIDSEVKLILPTIYLFYYVPSIIFGLTYGALRFYCFVKVYQQYIIDGKEGRVDGNYISIDRYVDDDLFYTIVVAIMSVTVGVGFVVATLLFTILKEVSSLLKFLYVQTLMILQRAFSWFIYKTVYKKNITLALTHTDERIRKQAAKYINRSRDE
jgi:hypothetical protein